MGASLVHMLWLAYLASQNNGIVSINFNLFKEMWIEIGIMVVGLLFFPLVYKAVVDKTMVGEKIYKRKVKK